MNSFMIIIIIIAVGDQREVCNVAIYDVTTWRMSRTGIRGGLIPSDGMATFIRAVDEADFKM